MLLRRYEHGRDREAAKRIWREVGWLSDAVGEAQFDRDAGLAGGWVAEQDGEPECLVLTTDGRMRYLADELPLGLVAAVTTSRVGRQQGLAGRTTARALADLAENGAAVAALGMFDQGYYNKLGFGSGGYEHNVAFDPMDLTVPPATRPPRRLSLDDWEAIHQARLRRHRGHGACDITRPEFTRMDLAHEGKGFGLGYADDPDGGLSHLVWIGADDAGSGPYRVSLCLWRTPDQFRELLGLLRTLADQVKQVRLDEPAEIQLYDLLKRPLRTQQVTRGGKFATRIGAEPFWQMRILDLPRCVRAVALPGEPVRFNLSLTDPVDSRLTDEVTWRGCGGEYRVTLGAESAVEPGREAAWPTLTASINAFTRLWLGVRPALGLSVTDELAGPPALIEALDRALRLPEPKPDWRF